MQWEYCSYMVEPGRDQRITTSQGTIYRFPILEATLNELGSQGWELIFSENHRLVFKRPKPIAEDLIRRREPEATPVLAGAAVPAF